MGSNDHNSELVSAVSPNKEQNLLSVVIPRLAVLRTISIHIFINSRGKTFFIFDEEYWLESFWLEVLNISQSQKMEKL